MKKLLLIISSVLLAISVLGMVRVYLLPEQIDTKKETTLLSYQQQGTFAPGYNVDPSYIYGDYPGLPDNPKYPAQFVESMEINFSCDTTLTQPRQVAVSAILINPELWEKSYIVVPQEEKSGNFDLNFSIDTNQYRLIGESIDKEVGVVSKEYQLVITTSIVDNQTAGQSDSNFSQDFIMRLAPDFVGVDRNMNRRWSETLGKYSYTVHMKPNSLYEGTEIVVTPAPGPQVMDESNSIYTNLAKTMMMGFAYKYQSNYPTANLVEEVKLESIVENTGKWSKTTVLVPTTIKNDNFTLNVPLDLEELRTSFVNLGQETGMYAQNYNFTLKASVHTTGQTQFGPVDDTFTQSATLDLSLGQLEWSGQLNKAESGSIKRTDIIKKENIYFKFPVATLRTVFTILVAVFAGLLGFTLFRYRGGTAEISATEVEVRRAMKKYKGIIADIQELPPARPGEVLIKIASLDELVKTAEGLIKPVLHSEKKGQHIFIVLDDTTRYQYEIPGEEDVEATRITELTED